MIPESESDLSSYTALFTDPVQKQKARDIVVQLQPLENDVFRVNRDGDVELVTETDDVFATTDTSFADFLTWLVSDGQKPRPMDLLLPLLSQLTNLSPNVQKYLE